MGDGNSYTLGGGAVERTLTPDEAIARLETGASAEGLVVDLGEGLFARPDGPLGADGLLQRLKALRLLKSLAEMPCESFAEPPEAIRPDPRVKALLDVVAKAR